ADRGQVLARHLPVRAAAVHVQVSRRAREQGRAALGEHLLDLARHLTGEQLGPEQRLAGQAVLPPPPRSRGAPHGRAPGPGPAPGWPGGPAPAATARWSAAGPRSGPGTGAP